MTINIGIQLRHVFQVTSGATPASGNRDYWDGDLLWVTPQDLSDMKNYWLKDTQRKISESGYRASGTVIAPIYSIVLSKRAPIGQLAILKKPACSNQGCFLLTPRIESDSRFFLYWLSCQTKYLQGLGRGSTFMELSTDDLKTIRVPSLALSQQRAIADYLDRETDRLDTLTAAKERMLELLAERHQVLIAAAIAGGLDSVVRLKPHPDALLEDARRNEDKTNRTGDCTIATGDNGLTMQTAFPYPTKRLKHVVSLRQSRVNENEGESPYVGLENIEPWTGKLSNGLSTTTEDSAQCNVFRPGDVLFGKLRPYLAKVWVAEFEGRSTTECLVMRPINVESRFLGYACRRQDFIDAVNASTFGSKMPRAEWGFIGNIPIPIPKQHEQRAVADYLDRETARLDVLKVKIQSAIALLKERRASLIAAAVTGQIAVEGST